MPELDVQNELAAALADLRQAEADITAALVSAEADLSQPFLSTCLAIVRTHEAVISSLAAKMAAAGHYVETEVNSLRYAAVLIKAFSAAVQNDRMSIHPVTAPVAPPPIHAADIVSSRSQAAAESPAETPAQNPAEHADVSDGQSAGGHSTDPFHPEES